VRDGLYLEEEMEKLLLLVKDKETIYDTSSPTNTKYNGILMFVHGIFLIGGAFTLPDINALPKHVFLKSLQSFSRPRAPKSIGVKQHITSATPNKFSE
jgi:hypothetical protein